MSYNKVPPNSLEAEMAVLGAMLIEKEAAESVSEIIKPEYFYSDIHRTIYEAVGELRLANKPVDVVTLSEELRRSSRLEAVGGQKYLADLMDKVSTAAHTVAYAHIVKEKYQLRELIRASTRVVEKSFEASDDVKKIIDFAEQEVLAVSQTSTDHGFTAASQLAPDTIAHMEKVYSQHSGITGVPSGFLKLDDMTGGFQPSDMVILAARPSMGKTALALNIAYYAAVEKKIPVAIFSMEMDRTSIMQRLICSSARVSIHGVRHGKLNRDSWAPLTHASGLLSESPLYIDDSPGLTVLDVRNRTRRLMTQLKNEGKPLGMVMIDYLQLIRGTGRSESRQQEVAEISRLLKDLARSLKIPVIALSQLNRKSEDKTRTDNKPQLSDLRDSGSIEQDADIVAMIHREEYYKREDPTLKNKATLIVAKHRNGAVGDIPLAFFNEFTKFDNMAVEPMMSSGPEEAATAY